MPYNADRLHQYQAIQPQQQQQQQQQQPQQQPQVQQYRNHTAPGPPAYQLHPAHYANTNIPVQYAPLEVVVPQHNYHQPPSNQLFYPTQQSIPQAGHYVPVPSLNQRFPQNGNQQTILPDPQVAAAGQPYIQVEVPPKAITLSSPSPTNYQVLLLVLAEEYLAAANDGGMQEALVNGDASIDDYYKLVSMALGCMETVLTKYRLQPLKEAHLRFRFASILIAETQNDLEAETALSKGIDLCDRNRFLDLKYSMQVLLCRVLHRSSPKAATKAIDGIVEDVVAYKHTAWEYAFRLLRASLSINMHSHQDFVAGIHQLQKIADLASSRADHAVFAFAAATEALAHLQSSSGDSIDQVQRALAAARRVQLNQDVLSIPQIQVLIHYVDLCCSLQQSTKELVGSKLSAMQHMMDSIVNHGSWQDNGEIYLPLSPKSVQGTPPMGGDIVQERNGRQVLTVTWLPKRDVYAIGYLLSAIAAASKNAQNDHKAEAFLDEGIGLIRTNSATSTALSEPLTASANRLIWRKTFECQFLLEKVFLLCARSEWSQGRMLLSEIFKLSQGIRNQLPSEYYTLMQYAKGTIHQGTGQLAEALAIFLSRDLALPPTCNKTSHNNVRRDLALLAAMNSMLIIRSPSHPSNHLLSSIFSKVDPYLAASPNKTILASRSLIIANLDPSTHHLITSESLTSMLLVKKHLSTALLIAKTIGNTQITAMTLSVMSAKFFKGVVGEQAEKSGRAGHNMAYQSGMRLWMSVSNGMLADTLEKQGKFQEVEKMQQIAVKLAAQLPKTMQRFESTGATVADHENSKRSKQDGRAKNRYDDDDDVDELAR